MKPVLIFGLLLSLLAWAVLQPSVIRGYVEVEDAEGEITPKPRMRVFGPYTGKWVSSIKGEASVMLDEDYERTSKWKGRFILDGKMFEMSGVDDLGGKDNAYIWLFAYDDLQKKYVAWYHDEEGVNLKFERILFEKDKEENRFSFHLTRDTEFEFRTSMTFDLSNPDVLKYSFVINEPEDLTTMLKEFGTATRTVEK